MKKIISMMILIIIFTSCSSIDIKNFEKKENIKWKNLNEPFVFLDLEAGDIIIKEKEKNPLGIFGHAAIMGTDSVIVDYPKLGEKSYKININYWLEKDRKILILRYKDMNDEFKKHLIENMKKYFGEEYKLHMNKLNTNGFYCSQYIWFVYYITAKELGYDLDLDSNGGNFVYPYDFINSPYLKIVD